MALYVVARNYDCKDVDDNDGDDLFVAFALRRTLYSITRECIYQLSKLDLPFLSAEKQTRTLHKFTLT